MRDHRDNRIAALFVLLSLALPLTALSGSTAARQPYRDQRARHSEIRSRAEVLSKHPRLSRFDVKAAEARIDDDREMKKFDHAARSSSGSTATAPRLKLYNDSLEQTLEKMLEYVRR